MKYTKNHIACYDYFFERIDNLFSEEIFFNTIKKYEDQHIRLFCGKMKIKTKHRPVFCRLITSVIRNSGGLLVHKVKISQKSWNTTTLAAQDQ